MLEKRRSEGGREGGTRGSRESEGRKVERRRALVATPVVYYAQRRDQVSRGGERFARSRSIVSLRLIRKIKLVQFKLFFLNGFAWL